MSKEFKIKLRSITRNYLGETPPKDVERVNLDNLTPPEGGESEIIPKPFTRNYDLEDFDEKRYQVYPSPKTRHLKIKLRIRDFKEDDFYKE